jgi:large subunit ribosomal protein L40
MLEALWRQALLLPGYQFGRCLDRPRDSPSSRSHALRLTVCVCTTRFLSQELYHPDRPSYTDRAPWQPRRPDSAKALAAVLPPDQASAIHSTIAHAELTFRQQASESHRLALKQKHDLLFAASEELRCSYPGWYALASEGGPGESQDGMKNVLRPVEGSSQGRVEGLFPIEMRVPTDTPGRDGWDYSWQADGGGAAAKA